MDYKNIVKVILLTFIGFTTTQAWAERLFGTTRSGGPISTLVEINPTTGALISIIGSVGYAVNGLTYDVTTETLYGTTSFNDPSFSSGLLSINITTGAGTPIGAGGVGATLGDDTSALLTSNSAGQLYSWLEANQDDLILWDKAAGTATLVGNSGLSTAQHGLAFDNTDTLYMVNFDENIYTIDTVTGASTLLGPITPTTPQGNGAHHGDFNPVSNLYYGIDAIGPGAKNLYVIDASTQALISIIPTINNLHVLAFVTEEGPTSTDIPTMSNIGLAILVLLLLGTAIIQRRRVL